MSKTRGPGLANKANNCPVCGKRHVSRSERKACREPDPAVTEPARKGSPTTIYESDPLRGDTRAHLVARLLREGWDRRKIAKRLNLTKPQVDAVADRLGQK